MTRVSALALTAVAAALALAACGGESETSSAEAREVEARTQAEMLTDHFAAAVEAKDAKAFCALLSPNDKARLTSGRNDGEKRCLVVWGADRNPLFAARDPDLALEEIVKVESPNVVVRLANGGRLVLVQENGDWYVSLAPQGKESDR